MLETSDEVAIGYHDGVVVAAWARAPTARGIRRLRRALDEVPAPVRAAYLGVVDTRGGTPARDAREELVALLAERRVAPIVMVLEGPPLLVGTVGAVLAGMNMLFPDGSAREVFTSMERGLEYLRREMQPPRDAAWSARVAALARELATR